MSLFLSTIADNVAGIALFSLPSSTTPGKVIDVEGYLTEDPTIKLNNNWEAIIPDLTSLSDFSQIAGLGAKSWIGTSAASWKGTDPIVVDLNFYLLTSRKAQLTGGGKGLNMPVSQQASAFAQLCALSPYGSGYAASDDDVTSNVSVNVHGGYKPQLFNRNRDFTAPEKKVTDWDTKLSDLYNSTISNEQGTIQIVINGGGHPTMVFTKMLLSSITFNSSTVRAGYWEGGRFIKSSEPLYIRCSASFRLAHAATIDDAARIFTGRGA